LRTPLLASLLAVDLIFMVLFIGSVPAAKTIEIEIRFLG
jgi:hypothetical protein